MGRGFAASGAAWPGSAELALIGALPTTSLLTRSIKPFAFDTMRPVAFSTRPMYVSSASRPDFGSHPALPAAAGGFACGRDALSSAEPWPGGGAVEAPLVLDVAAAPDDGAISVDARSDMLLSGGARTSATTTALAAPTTRRGRASRRRLKLRTFSKRARSSASGAAMGRGERNVPDRSVAGTMAKPFVLTSRST